MTLSLDAAVLLDEDWDDGDRTDTNLPEESAWFGSVAGTTGTLSAATNALTGLVRTEVNASSRLWITHFTPAGSPVVLAPGDAIKLTLVFTASNVATTSSTQRGLRFGLFNFSEPGANRVTGDGFSTGGGAGGPGVNVTGYMLNMNFWTTLINNPMQIMKRLDMTTNNLMGTTAAGAYAQLGSSGGGSAGSGFTSGAPYTLEFLIRRLLTSVQITTTFSDTNGWSISHTATDSSSPTFAFDGFGIRPNGATDTADSFDFTRLKVETIPFNFRISSVQFRPPTTFELRWDALPGKTYEVQWRDGLEPDKAWNLLGTVPAQDTTASIEDGDVSFTVQRFYRVFQVPPAP